VAQEKVVFHNLKTPDKVHAVYVPLEGRIADRDDSTLIRFLDRHVKELELQSEMMSDWSKLELTYEDDIEQNPHNGYEKVCEFLDLEPIAAKARWAKTNPFPLSQLIRNWEEVCEEISSTSHSWMLELD
jgi:hypothetical protein